MTKGSAASTTAAPRPGRRLTSRMARASEVGSERSVGRHLHVSLGEAELGVALVAEAFAAGKGDPDAVDAAPEQPLLGREVPDMVHGSDKVWARREAHGIAGLVKHPRRRELAIEAR